MFDDGQAILLRTIEEVDGEKVGGDNRFGISITVARYIHRPATGR